MPRKPQAAKVEDYDSDESAVKPETARQATCQHAPERPLMRNPPSTSESQHGPSSRGRAFTQPEAAGPARKSTRQNAPPVSLKNRPQVHANDRQRGRENVPARSSSTSRKEAACTGENCLDVNCPAYRTRYAELYARRAEAAHHAQRPAPPVLPTLLTQPQTRPRAASTSRPRPVSIHGYSTSSVPTLALRGPPPSPSAYQPNWRYSAQPYYAAHYATTPPSPIITSYPPPSPAITSPAAVNYGPALQPAYSARQVNPDLVAYGRDYAKTAPQPIPTRTISARESTRGMPGSYPEPESPESESASEMSDAEIERHHSYWSARAREARRPSRTSADRPPMRLRYSTPAPSASARDTRQQRRFDDYEQPSSSDYVDSDRTVRAVVARRTNSDYSSRSRRPSISSHASSGRTKTTANTSSSGSGSGAKVVVEDRYGRRTAYLSDEARAQLHQQYERQKQEEQRRADEAEAYQKATGGGRRAELTKENIETIESAQKSQRRHSGSFMLGHSRKTSRSSSKASQRPPSEGIQIQTGDTLLHVYGDAKIEMRPSEDGGPAQFIVASTSGRDSAYFSASKSSGSRKGRSRAAPGSDAGREREMTIREEDASS